MLAAYVFSLVLGGGFLLVSVLGDALGGDSIELDVDAHVDGDFDAHVDVDGDATHASKLFSFRTVVYALFGFGAVGSIMSWLQLGSPLSTFLFALVGGTASGAVVNVAFRYLYATDTGAHPGDQSLVGLSGRVTLPLTERVPGTIAVERGARRLALRAIPHESSAGGDISSWTNVVVVEMDKGIAKVAPVGNELASGEDA